MDTEILVSGPKANKIYSCSRCNYQAKRIYNVQRHLAKHFDKPPKELQHLCPHANCSFSTVRWDNLTRHISKLHRKTNQKSEDPPIVTKDVKTAKSQQGNKRLALPIEAEHQTVQFHDETEIFLSEDEFKILHFDNDSQSMPCENDTEAVLYEEDIALASVASDEDIEAVTDEGNSDTALVSKPPDTRSSTKHNVLKDEKKETKANTANNTVQKRKYKNSKYKIYECIDCNYRTNRGYNIKRHLIKHTQPLTLHVCVISGCGFSTPRWDNLCRHVKRIHPNAAQSTEPEP